MKNTQQQTTTNGYEYNNSSKLGISVCPKCEWRIDLNTHDKCVCGKDYKEEFALVLEMQRRAAYIGDIHNFTTGAKYGTAYNIERLTNAQIRAINLLPMHKSMYNRARYMTVRDYKNINTQTHE